MPKRVSIACKCSRYNPYMGLLDALPLSTAANVPTMPDNRDSCSRQHRLLSSPSTTTTAPTMRSRSKPYNLCSRSTKLGIKKNIHKPPIRRKLVYDNASYGPTSYFQKFLCFYLWNLLSHPYSYPHYFGRWGMLAGLANYKLMCELFSGSTATGLFHRASTASLGDTDDERKFEDELNGLGIDDNHDPPVPSPFAQRSLSPSRTNSGRRTIDNLSSVHLRPKRSKEKLRSDTNDMALLKLLALRIIATTFSKIGLHSRVELSALFGEDEHAMFLKGCKELENSFKQNVFMIMTDAQRKTWLYSL
ncbi:hypothetical protein CJ030_MR2G012457 [Morella rubra]|uniref:Uncharacterized protein n=1 Tax=Morella rubra TaxID=262757 RepID=A0A6A1WKR9_9ROSI|nr:hypothetical protein CJ030_MR2G012457 [Morella rubra]